MYIIVSRYAYGIFILQVHVFTHTKITQMWNAYFANWIRVYYDSSSTKWQLLRDVNGTLFGRVCAFNEKRRNAQRKLFFVFFSVLTAIQMQKIYTHVYLS